MIVIREYAKIVATEEVREMKLEYKRRFGKSFIPFNYADFRGTETMRAGQQYVDTLRHALETNTPYEIESHRYDDFDH